jgi:hypothetical protein
MDSKQFSEIVQPAPQYEEHSELDASPAVVLTKLKVLSPNATPSSSSRHALSKPVVVPRE